MLPNSRIHRIVKLTGVATVMLVLAVVFCSAETRSLERDSIPEKYKWDLSHIFPDWETWETGMSRIDTLIERFEAYRGTLNRGGANLLAAFRARDEMDMAFEKISSYVGLMYSTDLRDNEVAARYQLRNAKRSRARTAKAWFRPELLAIPRDSLESWLVIEPGLADYQYEINNEFRRQEHILDKDTEELLSYYANFNSSPGRIYNALSTADIDYPVIKLGDTAEIKLSEGRYNNFLTTNRNQAERAAAFDSLIETYSTNAYTYAAIYSAILQRDWANARARGYAGTLDYFLDYDNVPTEVYANLIATAKKGSEVIRRYFRLKKRVLDIDAYHMYDRFLPIVDFDARYAYDDIVDKIIASVEPLGQDYQGKLREGFENRWIDVYENEGKSTGGFSSGVYGVHPYVLVNYNETAGEMFTVAHEMGHSLHTVLADENQPYATAGYSIFVAEVAAIANEQLLLHYLLENTDDVRERVYLLQNMLDGLRGTFFRQLLFADFEWRAHQMVENSQPVTPEALYELYMNVTDDFYGDDLATDSLLGYYWSTVPHFFFGPYYVYKYATSYAAATHLINAIVSAEGAKRQQATDRFLNLLKAGGSDYPMNLLKEAGVDMSDPKTYEAIIDLTDDLVTRLERELTKL